MIVFDKLWTVMQARGVSTYQLREKCGIDSKTIRRLRANENLETKTLNTGNLFLISCIGMPFLCSGGYSVFNWLQFYKSEF